MMIRVSEMISNAQYNVTEPFADYIVGESVVAVVTRVSTGEYLISLIGPQAKKNKGLVLSGDERLPLE